MKTILLLVFLVSLPSVLGRPLTLRGSCLDQVNHLRQEYAQKYNIANMNQLIYDVDWEGNIQRYLGVHGSCEKEERVQNGMVIMTGTLKNDELFNPDSSRMACLKSKCVETGQDVYTFLLNEGSSLMVYGSPGSRCPPDHPSSNNGLCSSSSSSSSKPKSRKNFLGVIDIDWGKVGFPEVNKCIVGNCDYRDDSPKRPEFPKKEVPSKSGGFWDLFKDMNIECPRVCVVGPCSCF
ncbi:hypothetical protein CAEBREN_17854 [Caenorhabditis brenneri]|uniref:Uncharacterized protein n=1 Tax=Caenorhabditis brenneri TaxID=135651 RepID=G0MD49_CAEBE|nr:hypothetical protein CAEBREN_17854 [Caenorhabditis brenneri]